MVTGSDLLRLAGHSVDLGPRPVEGAPAHRVRPVLALAADPAAAELIEIAKLVGALRLGVDGGGICCVVARCCEAGVPVEVGRDAVVIVY